MITAELDAAKTTSGIVPEDRARADIYGLIASLFYRPPSKDLLVAIAAEDGICSGAADSSLSQVWRELQSAAAKANAVSVKQEYDALFIGVGRAPVLMYGSYYLTGFLMEKPLVKLRRDLAQMGLARHESTREPEDHLSALCDVMRFLIVGDRETAP